MARASTVEVREHLDLFSWARLEAQRVEAMRVEQAARVKREAEAELELTMAGSWQALDAAKRDLANAKKAALEEDMAVADAKAAVKQARKATKGLAALAALKDAKQAAKAGEAGIRTAERDLATALAKGEAPGS